MSLVGALAPGVRCPRSNVSPGFELRKLVFDEVQNEIEEVIHAIEEFLFDGGEVFFLRFAVVVAVLAAAFAPAAGVEAIDQGGGTDEIEGGDDPLMVDFAVPEAMEPVLSFDEGDGLIDIEQCPLLTAELAFGRFFFEALDEGLDFFRPFDRFVCKHSAPG